MATETKTFYLGEFLRDESSANVTNWNNAIGHGADNSTYANVQVGKSTGATGYAFWRFDTSLIPQNASVDSVSCVVKTSMMSTSAISAAEAQLYSGSEPKGSPLSIKSTVASSRKMTPGTWTRDELRDCRLRIYYLGGSSTTQTRNIYLFGADLTVTYTYQSEKFMLKLSGDYKDIARVFKKANGIWVEQTDLANVIEDGVRYQNGGEYVAPNPVVNIVGTGNSSNCHVTINGVKYTSGAKVSVEPGTVITLVMKGSNYSMPGAVFVDNGSQPAESGTNVTYNHTVTNNSVIQFMYTAGGSIYNGVAYILTGVDGNVAAFSVTDAGFTYEFAFGTGMTWAEFCGSRFNIPFGATVSGNQIGWSDGSYLADVILTDVIVAGKTYTRTGL